MMMRMLEAGGLPCLYDSSIESADVAQFNPNGYYEHPDIFKRDWSVLDGFEGAVKMHGSVTSLPERFHHDLRVIVMRRDIEAIDASMQNMRAATGSFAASRDFFEGDLDAIRVFTANKRHVEVWYDEALFDPVHQALRVALCIYPDWNRTTAPCPLNLADMAAVADPQLRHH